ncbi:thiamine biosynthesis protein ThiS [Asticcacaulis solisilvae]|nr:thiamine biosynthesis protein ThiS [Asticcacaulis solisilvae]MDR6799208.1 thiamine biosynthesis protein ThiS [Asticcacaulis sp. BE141]
MLNGEEKQVAAGTVTALIDEIGLDGRKVAVERNLEIVPKSQYLGTALSDGDRIEIVHFVGGG